MIHVVIPTLLSEKDYKNTVAFKCLNRLMQNAECNKNKLGFYYTILEKNKEGFCKLYNQFIENDPVTNGDSIITFIHDDLEIYDQFFVEKLLKAHQSYDVVGLAGASSQDYTDLSRPLAWHLCMRNGQKDGRGFVSHGIPANIAFPTAFINASYFGPTPAEAVFIDGVFMSFNAKNIRASGVYFNEKYTFQHYDMSACADAKKIGLKIGVYPIFAIHHGLGDFNAEALWHTSAKEFRQDYGDYIISI